MRVPFLDLAAGYRELERELDEACRRVLSSGFYVGGEPLEAFERDFARYCGARHCVGVGNGLDALALTLRAYGIGPGDDVLVPAHTFIATWLAVSATGARIVPIEPDSATLNVDPRRLGDALTPATRAVIVVHLYGLPVDLEPILERARPRGIRVIEDAAQAHGADVGDRRVGSLGDAACFSFYPVKNLGAAGDAGAVVTDDEGLAARLRALGNYGALRKYEHETRGVNSRLDPIQAALLRVKLARLDEWNRRRQAVATAYLEGLRGLRGLILPSVPSRARPVWHQFVVRHPRRDRLRELLARQGVETLIHYPTPPHLTGAYRDLGYRPGDFPTAEEAARSVLSLPMGPHLSREAVDAVIRATAGAVRSVGGE